MASPFSTRLWLTYREAGHPQPEVSDDDVLNFLYMEAMIVKIGEENKVATEQAQTAAAAEAHRNSHKGATVESLAAAAKAREQG